MRAVADALLFCVVGLTVIAVAGDALARFVERVAFPGCALVAAALLGRLVWFYTSRW